MTTKNKKPKTFKEFALMRDELGASSWLFFYTEKEVSDEAEDGEIIYKVTYEPFGKSRRGIDKF